MQEKLKEEIKVLQKAHRGLREDIQRIHRSFFCDEYEKHAKSDAVPRKKQTDKRWYVANKENEIAEIKQCYDGNKRHSKEHGNEIVGNKRELYKLREQANNSYSNNARSKYSLNSSCVRYPTEKSKNSRYEEYVKAGLNVNYELYSEYMQDKAKREKSKDSTKAVENHKNLYLHRMELLKDQLSLVRAELHGAALSKRRRATQEKAPVETFNTSVTLRSREPLEGIVKRKHALQVFAQLPDISILNNKTVGDEDIKSKSNQESIGEKYEVEEADTRQFPSNSISKLISIQNDIKAHLDIYTQSEALNIPPKAPSKPSTKDNEVNTSPIPTQPREILNEDCSRAFASKDDIVKESKGKGEVCRGCGKRRGKRRRQRFCELCVELLHRGYSSSDCPARIDKN
eukprot:TRINITY_DN12320_c0_g1_i8.p1 TRINITY_DN12320_c0_g1~~TRINITY_DN12320_c0_g1_i8.p1  ORF type:complete len:452 (+),score=97.57 TRINITY_DN12320_c0_g1_i8:159-1358(+)